MELAILILLALLLAACTVLVVLVLRMRRGITHELTDELEESQSMLRQELTGSVQTSVSTLGRMISDNQQGAAISSEARFKTFESANEAKLDSIRQTMEQRLTAIQNDSDKRLDSMREIVDEKLPRSLETIRQTMERRLTDMQSDNGKRLDAMREIVDEKLQKTLETRMSESFKLVSERLEQVYRGLGEMQTLATGVGDLKKVLSNVKTRGILGEIQLGAILVEILSPEQYDENVVTKPGSRDRVEFAIKLPTDDGSHIYLPIDSKFPGDLYASLQDAYASGSQEDIRAALAALTARIKQEAKDIRDKYIDPPNTTEFAILFLPFEGLYAEVVNRGLVEELQRAYRVNVAGPSTMAALLNSLQMGFRTFAIQKRSGEVWRVLGAVKTEFENFEKILASSQKKIQQANDDLDKLIGVRTRSIVRKLRDVERIDEISAAKLFDRIDPREELPEGDPGDNGTE